VNSRSALGRLGERLAAGHLRREGFAIVATNVAVRPWGEIDIIAEKDGVRALVEVRTRRGERFGGAGESLSPTKRRRMINAAQAYLATLGDDPPPCRIDAITVHFDGVGRLLAITHFENALESD